MMRSFALAAMVVGTLPGVARAQDQAPAADYATSPDNLKTGMAPGLKATELSPKTRAFQIVMAKGDDVGPGLAEFAEKNHLANAHFSAIGALDHAVIGWSDRSKHAFRVVRLDEEMEIASFTGSITRGRDGKPMVHAHCVVALLRNGRVYAGHFLEGRVSLTLQMYLTDSEPLQPAGATAHRD